eukprot:2217779-Prymnesium_polylepis.1
MRHEGGRNSPAAAVAAPPRSRAASQPLPAAHGGRRTHGGESARTHGGESARTPERTAVRVRSLEHAAPPHGHFSRLFAGAAGASTQSTQAVCRVCIRPAWQRGSSEGHA